MKLLRLLALSLAFMVALPAPVIATPAPVPDQNNSRMLICGHFMGTAWVAGKNILATARHVIDHDRCYDFVTGREAVPYLIDKAHDFALLSYDTSGLEPLHYSCARMGEHVYESFGYGHGEWQSVFLFGSHFRTRRDFLVGRDQTPYPGMRQFMGSIIGGMSGGPIVDADNIVHGINNVSNPVASGSYELADTALCKR